MDLAEKDLVYERNIQLILVLLMLMERDIWKIYHEYKLLVRDRHDKSLIFYLLPHLLLGFHCDIQSAKKKISQLNVK